MNQHFARNERGLSLVATMVAVALAGGLALVLAELFGMNIKTQKNAQQASDASSIQNQINFSTGNSVVCNKTRFLSDLSLGTNATFDPGSGNTDFNTLAVQNGSVFVPVLTLGQTTGTLNVTGLSFSNVDCTVDATERVCTANLETQFTKTGSGNLGGNTKIFESFIAFRLTGTTGMGTITGCEVGAAGGGGPVGGDGGGTDGGGDAGDPGDFLECAALPNGYYHNNICHNKIPVYKADPPVTAAPGTFWVRDPAGMDPPPH